MKFKKVMMFKNKRDFKNFWTKMNFIIVTRKKKSYRNNNWCNYLI